MSASARQVAEADQRRVHSLPTAAIQAKPALATRDAVEAHAVISDPSDPDQSRLITELLMFEDPDALFKSVVKAFVRKREEKAGVTLCLAEKAVFHCLGCICSLVLPLLFLQPLARTRLLLCLPAEVCLVL